MKEKETYQKRSRAIAKDPPGSEGFVLTNKVYAKGVDFCIRRSAS